MDLKEERPLFYLSIKVIGWPLKRRDRFICQSKSWDGLKRGETVLFVNQSDGMDLKEERLFYLSIKVMGWPLKWRDSFICQSTSLDKS